MFALNPCIPFMTYVRSYWCCTTSSWCSIVTVRQHHCATLLLGDIITGQHSHCAAPSSLGGNITLYGIVSVRHHHYAALSLGGTITGRHRHRAAPSLGGIITIQHLSFGNIPTLHVSFIAFIFSVATTVSPSIHAF